MFFEAVGRSEKGRRSNNEDAWLVDEGLGLFVVADGMGGAAAGEVASRLFVETAREVFLTRSGDTPSLVLEIFREANRRIRDHIADHPEHKGMGCTAEVLALQGGKYYLGHIGDSRTYLLRDGLLKRVTKDHSFVQEQIDRGLLTPEEAKGHRFRHVILRAVGVEDTLAVDLIRGGLKAGDLFLLCSDGLTDEVDDEKIEDVLKSEIPLEEKADRLISLAMEAGGKDNITVVLCELGSLY